MPRCCSFNWFIHSFFRIHFFAFIVNGLLNLYAHHLTKFYPRTKLRTSSHRVDACFSDFLRHPIPIRESVQSHRSVFVRCPGAATVRTTLSVVASFISNFFTFLATWFTTDEQSNPMADSLNRCRLGVSLSGLRRKFWRSFCCDLLSLLYSFGNG